MEPEAYLVPLLEREYTAEHPGLTDDAVELLRAQVVAHPEKYARSDRSRALVAYSAARRRLIRTYDAISDLPDEEFEPKRDALFLETRRALAQAVELDAQCVEARLLDVLLGAPSYDACLSDLLALAHEASEYLSRTHEGFDPENLGSAGAPADDPVLVGLLHTYEAISQSCLATARYRAAEKYARMVMCVDGYPNRAEGTLLLALARLEDEPAFFAAVEECRAYGKDVDSSPWFMLARGLLFYKVRKYKQARRAMKDFALRSDGGAYFLAAPEYPMPYFPARPEPRESWELAQQAVYEADAVIIDTPDFAVWATSIEEVGQAADRFAKRNGWF